MSSAWEQWGGKKPAGSGLAAAQDAFQSLLRSSPLSSSTASTASSSGSPLGGDASSATFSLKKAWDSARDLTKAAVGAAPTANAAALQEADAMENGQIDQVDEKTAATWPLWRKNSGADASLLPTMSW